MDSTRAKCGLWTGPSVFNRLDLISKIYRKICYTQSPNSRSLFPQMYDNTRNKHRKHTACNPEQTTLFILHTMSRGRLHMRALMSAQSWFARRHQRATATVWLAWFGPPATRADTPRAIAEAVAGAFRRNYSTTLHSPRARRLRARSPASALGASDTPIRSPCGASRTRHTPRVRHHRARCRSPEHKTHEGADDSARG